jgi:hypothetical protein
VGVGSGCEGAGISLVSGVVADVDWVKGMQLMLVLALELLLELV